MNLASVLEAFASAVKTLETILSDHARSVPQETIILMNQIDRLRFIVSLLTTPQALMARAKLNMREPAIGWEICGKLLENPSAAHLIVTQAQLMRAIDCCAEVLSKEPNPLDDGVGWDQIREADEDDCGIFGGNEHNWIIINCEDEVYTVARMNNATFVVGPPETAEPSPDKGLAPVLKLVVQPRSADGDAPESA